MKKLTKCFYIFIAIMTFGFICLLTSQNFIGCKTYAQSNDISVKVENYLMDFVETSKSNDEKSRLGRVAGSEAEYNSAMYIVEKMRELNKFDAVNNSSTADGIEQFEFISEINGNKQISQNIIFRREAALDTDKKVIICTHYDSCYVVTGSENGKTTYLKTDGINDNAGSVAALLSIADSINNMEIDPGFDIEIVFFGASRNSYAGSKYYLRGLSDDDVNNILLVINLDKITVGANNYFYVNEFGTPQESYFANIFKNNTSFKQLNGSNLNKFNESGDDILGLGYTHVGIESDNKIFMSRNINSLNLLSGDYESFRLSETEFTSVSNITGTENDNYFYVMTNYNHALNNLVSTHDSVLLLISDSCFVSEMQKGNNLQEIYSFWTNTKLSAFITVITFLVCLFIIYLIYGHLKKQSKKAVIGDGLEQLVIKIARNIGEDDIDDMKDIIEQNPSDDENQHKSNNNEE